MKLNKYNHILIKLATDEISEEFSPFNQSDSLLLAKMNDVYTGRVLPQGTQLPLMQRMTTQVSTIEFDDKDEGPSQLTMKINYKSLNPNQKKEKKRVKLIITRRLLISFEKALWVKFDLIQNLNATDMIEICRQLEHDDIWNDCLKTLCQGEQ